MNSRDDNQQKFAQAVLKITEEKKLSLRKLAAASGLEYSQVQRVATAKINLSLSTIIALAAGLEVQPSELFVFFDQSNQK